MTQHTPGLDEVHSARHPLSSRLVDHEGEVTAGNFVWRPAGSRHVASSPNGALVLGFFLKPNTFF